MLLLLLLLLLLLQTGDLPDSEMVPEHNDERWMDEDREHERGAAAAAGAAGAAGKKKHKQGAGSAVIIDPSMPTAELMKYAREFVSAVTAEPGSGGANRGSSSSKHKPGSSSSKHELPLQVAKGLRLVALGRVDYLHPHFHNDKLIFPAGFTVERRAKTPSGGDREMWYRAEILRNPDGSGPLFRCVEVCEGWVLSSSAGLAAVDVSGTQSSFSAIMAP
jgi:hypothetical protein